MAKDLRDVLYNLNDPTNSRKELSINDELVLFLKEPKGAGGSGFTLAKTFATTQSRDTYYQSNPNELAQLKANPFSLVQVGNQFYKYDTDKFVPVTGIVKGDKGDKGNDGTGIDITSLKNGEIPVFDTKTNSLKPSGVLADDGDITIAPSSVTFGNHKMSSSIENVIFTNTETGKVYAPLWQEVGANQDDGYLRDYNKEQEVVRVPMGDIDVTNPTNVGIVIDKDETFFGGKFTLSQDATNVELIVTDQHNHEVWREKLGDLKAGIQDVTFKIPVDIRVGYVYSIQIKSYDGSDVVVKSNNNYGFSWTIKRSTWKDRAVALRLDVGNTLRDVRLSNNKLIFEHLSPSKPDIEITLPQSQAGGSTNPKAIVSVSKSGNDFYFTHADGTRTAIVDNVADLSQINTALNSLAQRYTSLDNRISSVESKSHTYNEIEEELIKRGFKKDSTDSSNSYLKNSLAIFSSSWPTSTSGTVPLIKNKVTVTKGVSSPQRIFILVPVEEAGRVEGVKQQGGIAAPWSASDLTIEGKKYKAFVSPGSFNETSVTIEVELN